MCSVHRVEPDTDVSLTALEQPPQQIVLTATELRPPGTSGLGSFRTTVISSQTDFTYTQTSNLTIMIISILVQPNTIGGVDPPKTKQ